MRAACPSNKHNLCEACTGISSPQVWPVRLADAYEYRCTERACKHRSNISGCFICVCSKARTYRYLFGVIIIIILGSVSHTLREATKYADLDRHNRHIQHIHSDGWWRTCRLRCAKPKDKVTLHFFFYIYYTQNNTNIAGVTMSLYIIVEDPFIKDASSPLSKCSFMTLRMISNRVFALSVSPQSYLSILRRTLNIR